MKTASVHQKQPPPSVVISLSFERLSCDCARLISVLWLSACAYKHFNARLVNVITLGTEEQPIREVITKRLDALRRQDPRLLEGTIIQSDFSKFDDWPPYELQGPEALQREREAISVLKRYDYELKDLRVQVANGAAIAAFHLHYWGVIRQKQFDINSRVTLVLRREGDVWKIIHEHYSRFGEQVEPKALSEVGAREAEAVAQGDELTRAILDLLSDGLARDVVDISTAVNQKTGKYYDVLVIKKKLVELENGGKVIKIGEGEYLVKYQIRKT